ncbi:MAG: hypothetical protein JW795_18615 [Chitinivibrionales bacterium]|nr:hypothetical protein [Chitinivibrionales bacterium]
MDSNQPLAPKKKYKFSFRGKTPITKGWRTPNTFEADLIESRVREVRWKEIKSFIQFFPVILVIFMIVLLIFGFIGKAPWSEVFKVFIYLGVLAVFGVLVILIDTHQRRLLFNRDYEIVDAVVTSYDEVDNDYFLFLKTTFDETTKIRVPKTTCDASPKKTHVYLVGYRKGIEYPPKRYKLGPFIPVKPANEPPDA